MIPEEEREDEDVDVSGLELDPSKIQKAIDNFNQAAKKKVRVFLDHLERTTRIPFSKQNRVMSDREPPMPRTPQRCLGCGEDMLVAPGQFAQFHRACRHKRILIFS